MIEGVRIGPSTGGTGSKPSLGEQVTAAEASILSGEKRGEHYLLFDQIIELHEAIISAGTAYGSAARDQLFRGLPDAYTATLTLHNSPASQLLADLHALNRAEEITGGVIPFVVFLGNLKALTGGPEQAQAAVVKLNSLAQAGLFTGDAERFNRVPGFTFDWNAADGRPGVRTRAAFMQTYGEVSAFASAIAAAVSQAGFPNMPFNFDIESPRFQPYTYGH